MRMSIIKYDFLLPQLSHSENITPDRGWPSEVQHKFCTPNQIINNRSQYIALLTFKAIAAKLLTLQYTEFKNWAKTQFGLTQDKFSQFDFCSIPLIDNLSNQAFLSKTTNLEKRFSNMVEKRYNQLKALFIRNPQSFYEFTQHLLTTVNSELSNQTLDVEVLNANKTTKLTSFYSNNQINHQHELNKHEWALIAYIFQVNIEVFIINPQSVLIEHYLNHEQTKEFDLCIINKTNGNDLIVNFCGPNENELIRDGFQQASDSFHKCFYQVQSTENQKNTNSMTQITPTTKKLIEIQKKENETRVPIEKQQQNRIPTIQSTGTQKNTTSMPQVTPTTKKLIEIQRQQNETRVSIERQQQNLFQTMNIGDGLEQSNYYLNNQEDDDQDVIDSRNVQDLGEQNFRETRLKTNISLNTQQIVGEKCQICTDTISSGKRIEECGHLFCAECLSQWVISSFQCGKRSFADFWCSFPVSAGKECKKPIQPNLLKEFLGTDQYNQLSMNIQDVGNYFCPYEGCNMKMAVDKNSNKGLKQEYMCPSCNRPMCRICFQKYHGENEKNQPCPKVIQDITEGLGTAQRAVCPKCKVLSLKDEGCDHVKCHSCELEFCFVCSVDRQPTMAHGTHYHRKGCKNYAAWVDPETDKEIVIDEFDPKSCKICATSGVACKRPVSLEEYKQINSEWFK